MAEITSSSSTSVAAGAPPAQIDGRRAQQLLERALVLSERGDVAAAILSCRQAITLNPAAPQAYSMLGLLLERAGDSQDAIAAYEKVVQLDPGSLLERESLARLRTTAAQRRSTRDLFIFDEGELFDERATEPAASDGAAPNHSVAPAAPAPTSVPPPSPALRVAAPSTQPPSAAAERRIDASPAARAAAATAAKAKAPRADFVLPTFEEARPSTLQRLLARPSYYFRGLPLTATALAALLFLLWAHHFAASREFTAAAPAAGTTAATADKSVRDTSTPEPAPATAPAPGTQSGVPAPNVAPTNPAPAGATNTAPASPAAPSPSPAPPVTSAPAPPAAAAPHATPRVPAIPSPNTNTHTAPNNGGAMPDLPRPRIPLPAGDGGEPAHGVAGGGAAGGASSGGEPLNPGGAPNRDFTRVTPTSGRAAAPPRAAALAARDERFAASGNAGAIAAATRAIESGDDSAVRYQQRAQLYLVSGDNGRAVNDFRSAIAGYNDMIARGDRVALARAGIAASRSGIEVARKRR
jgi:Flp pilus assembly protein TadD